ncbi:MAG: family efflux transporter subunit, HlyD family secretion protein [Candidatus Taylorbacteria bacterium]|nr:family efflux transporter subunit, HlyD family secretion protein [Candidatus Taylorbacteria bacterium]
MSNFFSKTKNYVALHKIKSAIIFILVIIVLYYSYAKLFAASTTETKYTVEKVSKTTIISTVTGSGSVSASNQVDLKAKTSGKIIEIDAKPGDSIKAGTLIAKVDTRDAAIALQDAQISLTKLKSQSNNITILQAQNGVNDANESSAKAYSDAYSTMSDTYASMSDAFSGLDEMLNYRSGYLSDQNTFSIGQNITVARSAALEDYWKAKDSYDKSYLEFKTLTRSSDNSLIAGALSDTSATIKLLTKALTETRNTIDLIKAAKGTNNDTSNTTAVTDVTGWSTKINSSLDSITSSQNAINSADRSASEKAASLNDTENTSVPLDIQSAELNLAQKQYAYEDCFIRAPFDGVVANITVQPTNDISSGGSLGTFITKQKIVNISLNEVDIAKIKTGQKATLTFDAIDGLTIAGQVLEVDLVGTVSQGVVTYNVKIGLDTDDDRVKSGMSADASIITDVQQNIIAVPSSAIKTSGNASYVETLGKNLSDSELGTEVASTGTLTQIPVTIGVSDDTMTEVTEGLNEGDQIITKTTTGTATKTTTAAPSLLSGIGGRAAGGATRTTGGGGFGR